MMATIAEQNATLEQRVAERTAQLTQKTNDINAMLQNMTLGVCTIVPGNTIHPEYSAQLPVIFGIDGDIAGRDVLECLFAQSTLGADVRDQITVALGAVVGESSMMFEFNGHLLPREMQISVGGAQRVIQMEWSPIVGDGDVIEKLLFIAQDVTHLRELELASAQQKAELEVISRLLALPVGKFNDFTASATKFIASNRELIQAVDHTEEMTVAALFRNMHTIKGNARTLGLTLVTDVAHEAEQAYDRLRKDANEPWDAPRLLAELDRVEAAVARYVDVNDNKLGRNGRSQDLFTGRGAFVANEELDRLKQLATVISRSRDDAGVRELCGRVAGLGLVPLERIVSGCVDSVASLARELGKPEPRVALTGGDIAFTPPFAEALKSSLMHMVRNALDHGIEMPEERVRSGKPEQGELRIHCERKGDTVDLRVGDDGRGLALKALLTKGRAAGVFGADETPAPEVVAELIFRSGLSTAQAVTQMSGRGVGMDAVRTFLGEQGATAAIELTAPANDGDYAPFRFVIRVPNAAAGA
jgi:HPt (histidine-containing phosphotransfer) domain-containing protein